MPHSPSRSVFRCALLGCGDGARRHHLPILARLPHVEVVAVADTDAARRAEAQRLVPGADAFDDWHAAVEHPRVDGVVVCLPNDLHAPAARAALEHGLHLYLEKPVATTLEDADAVVDLWRRSACVGMAGLNYRFNALFRSARDVLSAGRLGELVVVRSMFTSRSDPAPWKLTRSTGGGALLDLGSHHVDLASWLLGEPVVEVRARIDSLRSEDDTAVVELQLASGLAVQSVFAFGRPSEDRFEIYGREGRLVVDRVRQKSALQRWPRLRYRLDARRTPGNEPSHRAALSQFVAAAGTATQARPDLTDGRAALAVIEAAERSARSGRAEAVAT